MKRVRIIGERVETRNLNVQWESNELAVMRAEAKRRGTMLSKLVRHWVRLGRSAEQGAVKA